MMDIDDLQVFAGDKHINGEDLHNLLEEAQTERQSLVDAAEEAELPSEKSDLWGEVALWDEENAEEMKVLEAVVDEVPNCEMMIRESEWAEYAQELVGGVGDLPRNLPSYIVIDWNATGDNLLADYTSVTYHKDTYYVRS